MSEVSIPARLVAAPREAVKRVATMKKEIAEAILRVQEAVEVLLKSEYNHYAKYNYVPIDTYYEEIVPLAVKQGLFWNCKMLNARMVSADCVMFDVVVDLRYKDGTIYPNIDEFFMVHPIIGAQTAGSAKSYADKIFMRSFFKIATGEGDSDQFPNVRAMRPAALDAGTGRSRQGASAPASSNRPAAALPGQDSVPSWLDHPDDPGIGHQATGHQVTGHQVTGHQVTGHQVTGDQPGRPEQRMAESRHDEPPPAKAISNTQTANAAPPPPATTAKPMETASERIQRMVTEAVRAKHAALEAQLGAVANAATSHDTLDLAWVTHRTTTRELETGTPQDRAVYARIKAVYAARRAALNAGASGASQPAPNAWEAGPSTVRPAPPFRRHLGPLPLDPAAR